MHLSTRTSTLSWRSSTTPLKDDHISGNLLVHSVLGGGGFRELHVVALSTTFLAALIICLIISFIVTYLAHRPRLALVMPSPFVSCLLNCNSFNSLVTPATCHRFTCFNKLHSRELHAAGSFLALSSDNSFSPFVDSIVIYSVRNLPLAR